MSKQSKLTFRKKLAIVAFALYVTFILLSAVPYIAESHTRVTQAIDSKYQYYLEFDEDGEQSHYDVDRMDNKNPATIELTYTTTSHTLSVKTTNIKRLAIDCQSIYEDESMKVFKEDPLDSYYTDYFKDHEKHLSVNVYTDDELTLRFKSVPEPIEVWVNETEWWKTETNYFMDDQDMVVNHVPKGDTHVELYFREPKEVVEEDEDDEEGMFGLGKVGKIDVFLLIILLIILVIIISTAGYLSWAKMAEEKAEKEEEAKYLEKKARNQKKNRMGRKKK